ncbi:MAG: DUF11 domain-containing protein [Clostridium sp.]|uniref:DUF11 domain-containing protein n=1 Tax=Clostridium sp. TaxID=1506 RepID=UPI003F380E85
MPSVSGTLKHAGTRNGSLGTYTNLAGFSICLYSPSSSLGLYVKTNSSGAFTFNSVPAGTYVVVECAKDNLGIVSPDDFTNATTIPAPVPSDPDYSQIPSPIANTNIVDSLSQNTFNVTVTTSNITGLNFIDSTIKNIPLSIPTGVLVNSNILINAANGTFGTLPAGTTINTSPSSYPYTNAITAGQLTYGQGVTGSIFLTENRYTLQNINTQGWFFTTNHTTFDERGYHFLINGGDPNAVLFKETISVLPNSFYLAGAWLNMITNAPGTCKIGFRALASDGVTQLFYGETTNIQFGIWGQIGQIFNTKDNSIISLQVLTMSSAGGGNDFVLDDVTLSKVTFDSNVILTKSLDKPYISAGDTITYTNTITYTTALTSPIFYDTVPAGTTFIPSSVKINSVSQPSYNPNLGFSIPSSTIDTVITITFDVIVVTVPNDGYIHNSSDLYYTLSIIPGNPIANSIMSNTVSALGLSPKLSLTKFVNKVFSTFGDTVTYTLSLVNTGNTSAKNITFFDTIPNGCILIPNSIFIDGIPSTSILPELTLPLNDLAPNESTTITFSVLVNN